MKKLELTCIECPRGCPLKVEMDDNSFLVTGNLCPKGKKYAYEEVTAPVRTVTSTVRLESGEMLPVKTDGGVPKDKIFAVMAKINALHPIKPVKIGDILLKNIEDEVNLVATKNIK